MQTVTKVYNLIILDESGSMDAMKAATISTFNELIQNITAQASQYAEQQHYIQFFSFNGNGIKEQITLQPVTQHSLLNEKNYRPDSMTPLYDAIGHASGKLRYKLEKEANYAVLVTILTDGEENASKEFTANTISNIIKELEEQNWVFTYMGTNHNVAHTASRLNIKNHFQFDNNEVSFKYAMNIEKKSRSAFYTKLREDHQVSKADFFQKEN